MGYPPLGVHDRAFSHLDDAVTGDEAGRVCGLDHVKMRPLEAVVMDVVSHFAKQQTFGDKDPESFVRERRVKMPEVVSCRLGRPHVEPKPSGEVLLPIPALIGNMRRVVHDNVEDPASEGDLQIRSLDGRPDPPLKIEADDAARAPTPEATRVHGGVENPRRWPARIEAEHGLKEVAVFPVPNRRKGGVRRFFRGAARRFALEHRELKREGHGASQSEVSPAV